MEVVSLDEFSRTSAVQKLDILKLDIQGGELSALSGAESLLRAGGISLIYTETMFVPHYERAPLFHELWSFLSGFGYSLFNIYDLHIGTNGQLRCADALFVCESARKNVIDKSPEEP